MLEKNKDYVEMRVSSTDCAFTQNEPTSICIDGYVYTSYMNLPDPGELYILISKEKFEKLQANVGINEELAKQWEINYNLLLKKTGFDTVEELVNYIYDNGPNSQMNWETLKEIIDDAEEDYISERDKAEELQKENEQLKKKLEEFSPVPGYSEFLKALYPEATEETIEKLVWITNQILDCPVSANGWEESAKFWKKRYDDLFKLVGFSSVAEMGDYLTNEAECDTLHEAILKLKDQVRYTCDEWYSANSRNNSWKAAAECNSPKELIEKREALEKEIEVYSRALNKWKEVTGCPSPSEAKTLIESGMSYEYAYHEIKASNVKLRELEEENADLYAEIRKWKDSTKCEKPEAAATWITSYESACERGNRLAKMVEKLKEEVDSWKNVTGYSIPEDYMHARISGAFHTPFDYTAAWQKATGCNTPDQAKSRIEGLENAVRLTDRTMIKELESNIDEWQKATGCSTPEQAKERIKALNERIDESEADYNHLLCTTGFESEGEIEDALDKCDHSTLRKALVDYEFDYDNLLKLTGYKSEQDIRVLLNDSEQFVYKDMRELINSLKRKAKFTESNWQKVTGFSIPEKCSSYIDRLEKKLEDIKNLTEED